MEGIRTALASARTCVRSPEACTLEVRAPGAAWLGIGESITTQSPEPTVALEARASGGDVSLLVNGVLAATASSGRVATVRVPSGRCSVVRAIVGRSWSSGIYVNCF